MDAYIKFGTLLREYDREIGVFNRKWPKDHEVEAMHETFSGFPVGYHDYHKEDPIPHPKMYMDQIGEFVPSGGKERFACSTTKAARAQGPPDWVSGPEGITYTCEDVTITMSTRLPIPEGCLNSDM